MLPALRQALKDRCTLGEVCGAMRDVFGRYQPSQLTGRRCSYAAVFFWQIALAVHIMFVVAAFGLLLGLPVDRRSPPSASTVARCRCSFASEWSWLARWSTQGC